MILSYLRIVVQMIMFGTNMKLVNGCASFATNRRDKIAVNVAKLYTKRNKSIYNPVFLQIPSERKWNDVSATVRIFALVKIHKMGYEVNPVSRRLTNRLASSLVRFWCGSRIKILSNFELFSFHYKRDVRCKWLRMKRYF